MGENVTAMGQHVTLVGCEKKEAKKELKKHAATIHCSNTLSLLQRKITNALLYHAYKDLMLKDEHEITVKQLCRLIGYQGNNHAAIKEALKGLISTIIEWNLIDDETGTENWTASSIIASVSLEGPLCFYAYSPRMKQLLHSPSMFGKIDLVIQSRFRSSYGLALYENCIRYRSLPHTKWFDMALFKKLMGVPSGKYDIFRDFKRRVLDKAINEVNTYSDLIIAAEYIKEGRKVVRVRFILKERAKKRRLGNYGKAKLQITSTTNELVSKLTTIFQLTEEQATNLLTEYDAEFIQEKMTLIEQSKPFQTNRIQNIAAYFISAVKNNYKPPKPKDNQPIAIDSHFEIEMTMLKRQIEEIRTDYYAYRERVLSEAVNVLDYEAKTAFMEQFYAFAQKTIKTVLRVQRSKYNRENVLESPQVKALLRQFALRELDMLAISSLEEFVAQQAEEKVIAWQKLKSYDPDHPLLHFQEKTVTWD